MEYICINKVIESAISIKELICNKEQELNSLFTNNRFGIIDVLILFIFQEGRKKVLITIVN
jgi:hypothetical protein